MILRGWALTAAATVLLAGCTGDPPPDADPPPSPAESSVTAVPEVAEPAPRPADRACYDLTYDEAVAPTSEAAIVPCRDEHSAMTFVVGTLDTDARGHLLAVDSEQVQTQVARECPDRFSRFVGGSLEDRRLSMLRAVWFTPTVEESDAGSDWFRCDVIAVGGPGSLAPLTGRLARVLGTEQGRDRYAMCGTAEPGTDAFERVVCSAQHSWRAVRTVVFDADTYPGRDRVRTAGEAPCEEAGRQAADDALNFTWGYEWPTPEQWRGGQTYGICWAPA